MTIHSDLQFDIEDRDFLRDEWHVGKGGNLFRIVDNHGRQKIEYLHRLIAARKIAPRKLSYKDRVRYQNRVVTDNRRDNVIVQTYTNAQQKARKRPSTTSKYHGVHWSKLHQMWYVKCYYRVDGILKRKFLGLFPKEKEREAGMAYDDFVVTVYDTPLLNFPERKAEVGALS